MIWIRITEKERKVCREVAQTLNQIHGGSLMDLKKTLVGMIAEFGAIKFMNYNMGATDFIEFRTQYNERGGDGGFDFRCAGMTWDVKFNRMKKVALSRLKASTADMILICDRLNPRYDRMAVRVAGCAPRLRMVRHLEAGDEAEGYRLMPMVSIRGMFPDAFASTRINENMPKNPIGPVRTRDILDGLGILPEEKTNA
jgi:hypothetical protein